MCIENWKNKNEKSIFIYNVYNVGRLYIFKDVSKSFC